MNRGGPKTRGACGARTPCFRYLFANRVTPTYKISLRPRNIRNDALGLCCSLTTSRQIRKTRFIKASIVGWSAILPAHRRKPMQMHIMRHLQYQHVEQYPQSLSKELKQNLEDRQAELRQCIEQRPDDPALNHEENEWLARSYPVLAVLAPVMSTNEDKIEFPGDPMILYTALSHAIDQASSPGSAALLPSHPTTTCVRNGAICPLTSIARMWMTTASASMMLPS